MGLPHEESSSCKLSGTWTGAHAKATTLDSCALGKLSCCLLSLHTGPPPERGGFPALSSVEDVQFHLRPLLRAQDNSVGISLGTLPWSASWAAGTSKLRLASNSENWLQDLDKLSKNGEASSFQEGKR